jgi:hypothetical protein
MNVYLIVSLYGLFGVVNSLTLKSGYVKHCIKHANLHRLFMIVTLACCDGNNTLQPIMTKVCAALNPRTAGMHLLVQCDVCHGFESGRTFASVVSANNC